MYLMQDDYKFPRKGTHQAQLLVKLLNGNLVLNAKAKDELDTPNPASTMSKLRLNKRWDNLIQRREKLGKASTGQATRVKEYFIEPKDIMDLKTNDPRIQKFLESNRKS